MHVRCQRFIGTTISRWDVCCRWVEWVEPVGWCGRESLISDAIICMCGDVVLIFFHVLKFVLSSLCLSFWCLMLFWSDDGGCDVIISPQTVGMLVITSISISLFEGDLGMLLITSIPFHCSKRLLGCCWSHLFPFTVRGDFWDVVDHIYSISLFKETFGMLLITSIPFHCSRGIWGCCWSHLFHFTVRGDFWDVVDHIYSISLFKGTFGMLLITSIPFNYSRVF